MTKKTIITAALLTFFSAGMLLSDTGGAVHAAETETASSSACKWKREYDGWTYTDESGKAVTNRWKKINGKWYFFNKGGIMEKNAYQNGYYLTQSGAWDNKPAVTGWRKNKTGWWYQLEDGSWLKNCWKKINGKWYHFNKEGYIETGWIKSGGKSYYLNEDGSMYTGWKKFGNDWYFFRYIGEMKTGWMDDLPDWYYFQSDGKMKTGWLTLKAMVQGTEKDTRYYFMPNGKLVTGWKKLDNTWYYFHGSGELASDIWVDGYYVDADGKWVPNKTQEEQNAVRLNVKNILQNPELPNGCEVTSLTTVLNYAGFDITKENLSDQFLPKGEIEETSPYEAFIGDPRDPDSWYCCCPAILKCTDAYFDSIETTKAVVDLTGCSFNILTSMIDSGKPVVVWGTLRIQPPQTLAYSWHVNGEEIPRYANLHCLVLTGYDKEKNVVYLSDPLVGNTTYRLDAFEKVFEDMGSQAIVISDTE